MDTLVVGFVPYLVKVIEFSEEYGETTIEGRGNVCVCVCVWCRGWDRR